MCSYGKKWKVCVGVEMEVITGVVMQKESGVIVIGVDRVCKCV